MADDDITQALERHDDLVERLRGGDVWALPSLMEAVTGGRVVKMLVIEDQRTAGSSWSQRPRLG